MKPEHLFCGTPRDNTLDSINKGRFSALRSHGDDHPQHKITDAQVIEIYHLKNKMHGVDIAKIFNISIHMVYAIWEKRTRKYAMAIL